MKKILLYTIFYKNYILIIMSTLSEFNYDQSLSEISNICSEINTLISNNEYYIEKSKVYDTDNNLIINEQLNNQLALLFEKIKVAIISGINSAKIQETTKNYPIKAILEKPFNEVNVKRVVELITKKDE